MGFPAFEDYELQLLLNKEFQSLIGIYGFSGAPCMRNISG